MKFYKAKTRDDEDIYINVQVIDSLEKNPWDEGELKKFNTVITHHSGSSCMHAFALNTLDDVHREIINAGL
jgi:hypothetical protein